MGKIEDTKTLWVTTEDNPFDPFTQGDRWYWYDMRMGYKTNMKVAANSYYSFDLSPDERRRAINTACIDLVTDDSRNFVFSLDGKYMFRYCLVEEGKGIPWGATEKDDIYKDDGVSGIAMQTNGVKWPVDDFRHELDDEPKGEEKKDDEVKHGEFDIPLDSIRRKEP